MTDIEGIRLPSLPNASVHRKMPAPFARPAITVGGSNPTAKREWRTILACDIEQGDIIPGVGRVHTVAENVAMPDHEHVLTMPGAVFHTQWTVAVEGGIGNRRTYQGNDQVWVFTARPTMDR